jgi:alkaline phosphatase
MATRLATHNDTQTLVKFLENYHRDDSNLQDIPFDKLSMSKAIDYYIGMPKHVVFIYETSDHKLKGVLMGSIEPFMFNEKRKWATDLINVAEQGGAWLMKRFISWAHMHKVDRIIMGISTEDPNADELYEAMQMTRLGGMYSMRGKEQS